MGVKQISEITRRDIAMLFVDGYYDHSRYWPDSKYSSPDDAKIFYPYYGRLTQENGAQLNVICPIFYYSTKNPIKNASGNINFFSPSMNFT